MTAPAEARDRLALALDVGDLAAAEALARRLAPWFGIAKVGFELYAEAGPTAFARLGDLGLRVFADLKLYDIPTTVERAARAIARHRVDYLNFHAAGGVTMLRAAVAGCVEGARDAQRTTPITLAVTVLTSDPDTRAFDARLACALDAGCDGVVCSASELEAVQRVSGGRLRSMVPGIRLGHDDAHDQVRIATPEDAFARGADWIVVGRAVTGAADPEQAAEEIARSAGAGLARAPRAT